MKGRTNRRSGLSLTPIVFGALHKDLIKALEEFYEVSPETLLDYQLYGFNYYDEELPSIKKLIWEKTGKWVNGKYLYNKYREWQKGNTPIRFTREFVFIYFQALGYKDIKDFLDHSSLSDKTLEEQSNLEKPTTLIPQNEYFVGYYIGEENQIIHTRLTLSDQNLGAHWVLAYWEKESEYSEYHYRGHIKYQQNGMSLIFTNDDSEIDRSLFIAVYWERNLKYKYILAGAYVGYDRNRQPAIGEVVFQRVESEEEQLDSLKRKKVDPIIAQHIAGRRWIITSKMPQTLSDLSYKSKFAHTIEEFIDTFRGVFVSIEYGVFVMEIEIRDNAGNSILRVAGHPIYKGVLQVQASGQMLIGRFFNDTTKAPLFMSLQVLPIRAYIFAGDLLGISRFDKSFCGKIYISRQEGITNELPSYRSSELLLDEIKGLPQSILYDLSDIFNSSKIGKDFLAENRTTTLEDKLHLAGGYRVKYRGVEGKDRVAQLTLTEQYEAMLQDGHLVYRGSAMLCEGDVLSIYFTECNGIPHCGQIIGKIGRKTRSELSSLNVKWLYLDDDFTPQVRLTAMIPVAQE
ncbi:MAG: hypothetical protein AAF694_04845 [Bacteroidota bacterium]